MAVLADDFIKSAALLFQGGSEIDWRNSISRAFYGVLHQTVDFAADKGIPDPNAHLKMGTHERLIEQLSAAPAQPIGKQLAYVLEDMKRKRVIADYRLKEPLLEREASQQLKTAERIEQLLATYP